VNRSLGDLPDTAKLLFFTSGKASLSGHTPLEALRSGSMPLIRIKACAQAYAQQ
jgi:hypothetical protein